jgi:hypothetical protein
MNVSECDVRYFLAAALRDCALVDIFLILVSLIEEKYIQIVYDSSVTQVHLVQPSQENM